MNSFTAETRRQLKREQKTRVMENLGRVYRHPADVSRAVCAAYGDPVRFRVRQSVRAHHAGGVSANDYQLMAALSRGLNTIWLCIALMLAITGPCSSALCTFTSVSHTARM